MDSLPREYLDAKKAFALACVEQLVPVLSEPIIQSQVYPLCHPFVSLAMFADSADAGISASHLWDPSNRETYESAHSVMLATFASHAQKASKREQGQQPGAAFAEKIVPMYAHCLVEVRPRTRP